MIFKPNLVLILGNIESNYDYMEAQTQSVLSLHSLGCWAKKFKPNHKFGLDGTNSDAINLNGAHIA